MKPYDYNDCKRGVVLVWERLKENTSHQITWDVIAVLHDNLSERVARTNQWDYVSAQYRKLNQYNDV